MSTHAQHVKQQEILFHFEIIKKKSQFKVATKLKQNHQTISLTPTCNNCN